MKYTIGTNGKIGSAISISRSVGPSCPPTCRYLPPVAGGEGDGDCWAWAIEQRFKGAAAASAQNMLPAGIDPTRSMLIHALKKELWIRLPDRGDFGSDGEVDKPWVAQFARSCDSVIETHGRLPIIWGYTHFIRSRYLAQTLGKYMKLYASVHNEKELNIAKRAGFTLFAMCDDETKLAPKKPKAGSRAAATYATDCPKLVTVGGERFVTCPEIRRMGDHITCAGGNGSLACQLCCKGLANVLFPLH
jgi:hypothetical protein